MTQDTTTYIPPLTIDGGAIPLKVIDRWRALSDYYLICEQVPNGSRCQILVSRARFEAHPEGARIVAKISAEIQ